MPVQVPLLQESATPPSPPEPSAFQTVHEGRVGGCRFFFRLCVIAAATLALKSNIEARLEELHVVALG